MNYKLEPANQYRSQAIDLLIANNLPVSDLDKSKPLYVLVIDEQVAATAGLELFEKTALLRSVSVKKDMQGQGLGKTIAREMEEIAKKKGVDTFYLLTTTAKDFFEKNGYIVIDRNEVPDTIRSSSEFSSVCPSTATVMKKDLTAKKKILFVCIENSNRSQMAQAFASMIGKDAVEAYSAGSKPSGIVNPKAIAAMKELGYNLQNHSSKSLDEAKTHAPFDAVVTMGCGDACPWMPAKKHIDWEIPDPRNMEREAFNKVRDLIKEKVSDLLITLK
ncbi:MAG TPA: arsenic resistance N-acetyltransferase ArsN2 [Chitinophagaceae bacterium]